MKITLLVNRDVHSNIALNRLLPSLAAHDISVFVSERVGAPPANYQPPNALLQLKYLEQSLFNTILSPLVERQPLSDARYLSFREIGNALGRAVQVLPNINTAKSLNLLAATEPDLIVSIRYGSILREQAISTARLGVINLHSGLLPRYKGILTTLHALLEDQQSVACTLHWINSADIDAGPIIATASVDVDISRSLLWHILQLYPPGCQLIVNAIDSLERGEELPDIAQSTSNTAYFSLPEINDFVRLQDKGFKVWEPADIDEVYGQYML